MRKIGGLILFLVLANVSAFAQKGVLDSAAIFKWPYIKGEEISADGKFVLYLRASYAELVDGFGEELIIRSLDNAVSFRYTGIGEAHFSMDGKYVAIMSSKDSLVMLNLDNRQVSNMGCVKSFEWDSRLDRDLIAWKDASGNLRIGNMSGNLISLIKRVTTFGYGARGRILFAVSGSDSPHGGSKELHVVDLENGLDKVVWTGSDIGKTICNEDERVLAFLGVKYPEQGCGIWRYSLGAREALSWISNTRDQNGDSIVVQQTDLGFLPEAGGIYFYLKRAAQAEKKAQTVSENVRVWRYDDEFEGSDELPVPPEKALNSFLAVAYLGSSRVVTINSETDAWGTLKIDQNPDYPYAIEMNRVNRKEGYRLPSERPDIYLVDLRDGTRHCVAKRIQNAAPAFSLNGRYVYWFNIQDDNYYAYNIKTGRTVNVSAGVKFPLYEEWDDVQQRMYSYGVVNWDNDDGRMLVYDRFDIWALDPNGERPPVDVSGGYGRANKIRLRFVFLNINLPTQTLLMYGKDTALLCGFDELTKENGFLKLKMHGSTKIEPLVMGKKVYYYSQDIGYTSFPKNLEAATASQTFLLTGMGVKEYPNLYVTSDFKKFLKISDLEPQRKYRWLTDTLCRWKTFTGKGGEGILYRPEDFDPHKKYPVIFYVYERLSSQLNCYLDPEFTRGGINIPWFVSRGYLVFCPDIWYKVGNPGAGVFDYVASAARYLAKKTWVDSTRMGILGHSWGGFEVNYLLTRTKLFAAAVSGSGLANLTSDYGLEGFAGPFGPAYCENLQVRMGSNLCAGRKAYVENSPVFWANKVGTPLLMLANPKDVNVSWEQGVEYFTILRRLQKKVWMLEYPTDHHTLGPKNSEDYTQRVGDFFDYYLKAGPEPDWMQKHQ